MSDFTFSGARAYTLDGKGRVSLPPGWEKEPLSILDTGTCVAVIAPRETFTRLGNRGHAARPISAHWRTRRFQPGILVRNSLGVCAGEDVVLWGCGRVALMASADVYNQMARRFGLRALTEMKRP